MHVHKNVKSIKKWNTASSALKHVEDLLKNVAKWLDKHTTSKWRNSRTDMTVSRGRNVVCEECTFLPIKLCPVIKPKKDDFMGRTVPSFWIASSIEEKEWNGGW